MPTWRDPGGGQASAVQPFLGRNRTTWAQAQGNSTNIHNIGISLQSTGTATVADVATSGLHASMRRLELLQTVAGTTNVVGARHNNAQIWRGDAAGLGGFMMCTRFGPATGVSNGSHRLFCGLRSSTGAPTDAEPSGFANVLGFGYDAADSSISFMHKTGSGTVVKDAVGAVIFAKPTVDRQEVYDCTIYCAPNDTTVYWEISNLRTGATASGSVSSDLPNPSTLLIPLVSMSVGGASAVCGIALMNILIDSDY